MEPLGLGLAVVYIVLGIITVATIYGWAIIFNKAGYNKWLSLTMVIPIVGTGIFLWFAFSKWPVYEYVQKGWYIRQLKSKRQKIEKEIDSYTEPTEESSLSQNRLNYCPNCGRRITEEMGYCPECGGKVKNQE